MPGQGREIRRRIKSIKSTRQITKAMELVSAAKMRKAVANVLATRPYATLAWEMVQQIAQKTGSQHHILLQEKIEREPNEYGNNEVQVHDITAGVSPSKIALILITSNRGLAGSLNANIISAADNYVLNQRTQGKEVEVVVLGKKGRDVFARRGYKIIAEFQKADVNEKVEEIRPIVRLVLDEYLKGSFERVMIAYTDFISTLNQKPRVRQLLPLVGADQYLGSVGKGAGNGGPAEKGVSSDGTEEEDGYVFEPSPEAVLDALLPRLVEVQLYQSILESDASEHSARMLAMRNATDAAGEMIDELTLLFNQTRQAGITQEIAEISAGRIAIEK